MDTNSAAHWTVTQGFPKMTLKIKMAYLPILRSGFRKFFDNHVLIKELLGMLARLPCGRRNMSGSMNGKHGGIYVKYVSLIVSFHWIKSIHCCMIVKDNGKGLMTRRNVSIS